MQVYLFEEAAKLNLTKFELGGKGYGLVEMTKLGLPVPPGIIITTEMCRRYFREGKVLLKKIEKIVVDVIENNGFQKGVSLLQLDKEKEQFFNKARKGWRLQ